jgi:hypothetical protein
VRSLPLRSPVALLLVLAVERDEPPVRRVEAVPLRVPVDEREFVLREPLLRELVLRELVPEPVAREVARLVFSAVFEAVVFTADEPAFGFAREVEAAFDDALFVEEEPARLAFPAVPLDFDLDCEAELRACAMNSSFVRFLRSGGCCSLGAHP